MIIFLYYSLVLYNQNILKKKLNFLISQITWPGFHLFLLCLFSEKIWDDPLCCSAPKFIFFSSFLKYFFWKLWGVLRWGYFIEQRWWVGSWGAWFDLSFVLQHFKIQFSPFWFVAWNGFWENFWVLHLGLLFNRRYVCVWREWILWN